MGNWRQTIRHLFDRLRPPPVERSPEEQQRVDEATARLALYRFRGCPYCSIVTRAIHQLSLNIELRDTLTHPEWAHELRQQGGKNQVPCLRIVEEDGSVRWMYESSEIVAYLRKRFGAA